MLLLLFLRTISITNFNICAKFDQSLMLMTVMALSVCGLFIDCPPCAAITDPRSRDYLPCPSQWAQAAMWALHACTPYVSVSGRGRGACCRIFRPHFGQHFERNTDLFCRFSVDYNPWEHRRHCFMAFGRRSLWGHRSVLLTRHWECRNGGLVKGDHHAVNNNQHNTGITSTSCIDLTKKYCQQQIGVENRPIIYEKQNQNNKEVYISRW